jgi:uncharacterized membrane protein
VEPRRRGAWSLRRLETVGAVAVIVTGVLLHFAYGWSGGSRLVAAVAPANESVWEHLKLVLIPVLALGAVEARWVADRRRLWWAKLVEVLAASGFVVAFFYTYTGALGVHSMVAVDIASFLAAVAGGQWLSYRIITATGRPAPLAVSVLALGLLVVGFGVLTFKPPHVPLFQEVSTGTYGPT